MNNKFKFKIGLGIVGLIALACTASAQLGRPQVIFSTASGTAAQGVTNNKVAYNITAPVNVKIDCTGHKELCIEARFQYLTTSIPATNTTFAFSTSVTETSIATNRMQSYFTWAVAGNTVDTGFITGVTNISVLGRPFVYLDSVLPLATLTNCTVKVYLK